MNTPSIQVPERIRGALARVVPMEGTTRYYDGPADVNGDVCLHQRYFTYRTDAGLVAGKNFNVMFTIKRPAKEAWPHFKDFNRWQNAANHYYSGVVGDLEGQTFRISLKPTDFGPHQYQVLRVIPEYMIVLFQPIPENGTGDTYLPGLGGVSPGLHVFMLNEHDGKTTLTILMEHASYASRERNMTAEDALRPWRNMAAQSHDKWRDIFVPTLKKLVYEH
jgi:hypothetical protein